MSECSGPECKHLSHHHEDQFKYSPRYQDDRERRFRKLLGIDEDKPTSSDLIRHGVLKFLDDRKNQDGAD